MSRHTTSTVDQTPSEEDQHLCSVCEDKEAAIYCTHCKIEYCGECIKKHSSLPACRNHLCKSIRVKNAIRCKIHSKIDISFFCKVCCCDACAVCILDEKHGEHKDQIFNIEDFLNQTLKENAPVASDKLNRLEKIKHFLNICKSNAATITEDIGRAVERIKTDLDNDEASLKRSVKAYSEEQDGHLKEIDFCITKLTKAKKDFEDACKNAENNSKEYENALLYKKCYTEQLECAHELLDRQYYSIQFEPSTAENHVIGNLYKNPYRKTESDHANVDGRKNLVE